MAKHKKATKAELEEIVNILERDLQNAEIRVIMARIEVADLKEDHEMVLGGMESYVRSTFANKIAEALVVGFDMAAAKTPLTELQKGDMIAAGIMAGYELMSDFKETAKIEAEVATMARKARVEQMHQRVYTITLPDPAVETVNPGLAEFGPTEDDKE